MIKRTIHLLTVLIFGGVSVFGFQGVNPAQAAGTALEVVVGTDPATTCADRQIAIRVTDVLDLTAYHLEISYDPEVIEIKNVVNGGFLGEPENEEFYEPTNSWSTPGFITYGMAQQNTASNPIVPRDGSGDLILVTLRALKPNASTQITIDAVNSALVNWPDAMPIAFTVTNAALETQSCPPVAQDQSVTTAEDTPVGITLVASDPDGDELTWEVSDPPHGTLTGTAPNMTYTPDEHYYGPDSFTFTVEDPYGETDTGAVSIIVTSVLDPPSISSADLPGPYMVGLNQEFHVTLSNPTYGDDFTNVLAKFRLENISTSDIASIEYLETALEPDQWLPLPITQDGEDVIGSFGPPAGFPMPPGYEATFSFRVTFNTAGTYPVTVTLYDLSPEPDAALAVYSDDVVVVDDLEVTDITLLSSVDKSTWEPVLGSLAAGFEMPLNIYQDWYYFDVDTLTVAPRALADGSYPFYFGDTPPGFFDYWAAKGVTASADPLSMQGLLWSIINKDLPLFYLKVTGTDYELIDGFTLEWYGREEPLRIEGDYLPGVYSFTGEVDDVLGFSDAVEVQVTFNDIPVAEDQTVETVEDTPVGITLNAIDLYPGTINWQIVSGPQNGSLSGTPPTLTYTPDENWFGQDSFTFKVDDGALQSAIATVTINVSSDNDPPVLIPIGNQSVDELVMLTFDADASDVDLGDTLTFSLEAGTAGAVPTGAVIYPVTGAFAWTPAEDQGGADYTFNVCVSDGQAADCETITVTVHDVNVPPVAVNDTYETDEDLDLVVDAVNGVLSNDSDTDLPADTLTAELVAGVSNGILTFNADGSFSYTPDQDYLGQDSFTYRVYDGAAWSNAATVTINVHEQNDPPVAEEDEYTTDEDTLLTVAAADGLLANDSDVDGDELTVELVSSPVSGELILDPNGSFTYDPADNVNGEITFTYKAYDGIERSEETTVTITVNPIDDPTVAQNQSVSTNEDEPINIILGLIEVDGDPLVWTVTDPQHGTLSGAPPTVTYTPDDNFYGDDSFTFYVHDGTSQSNTATISIHVISVNDIPLGEADTYTTEEDELLIVSALEGVLANDSDVDLPPQTLTAHLSDDVDYGTLIFYSDGHFFYDPDENFNGEDIFYYRVFDGEDYSLPVKVILNVSPVNDAPIANHDYYSVNEDTQLKVVAPGVLNNDHDPDGDAITAMWVGGPTVGMLNLSTDGSFIYTPPDNYYGSASFTYLATDGTSNSDTKTVSITIHSVEDAPVLGAIGNRSVNEETLLSFTAQASDNDPYSTLAFSLDGVVPTGAEIDPVTGEFTWTPSEAQGPDEYTFSVKVCDDTATPLCDSEEITVTVNEVNKPPVASDQNVTTNEDEAKDITLIASDPDGNPLVYTVSSPEHGVLSGTAPNLTYTPDDDWFGEDSFTFFVSDGTEVSNTSTVTIAVISVPDAPVLTPIGPQTATEGILLTFTASATDADPGTTLTFSLEDGTAGAVPSGAVIDPATGVFTWTPDETQGGVDYTFDVCVSDGALSDCETITVTVIETNTAPIITGQIPLTTPEDTSLEILVTDLVIVDPEDTTFTLTVLAGTNYTFTGNTITPAQNFVGDLTVNVKVNDGELDSPVYPLVVEVTPLNDAPVAHDQTVSTAFETAVNITLTMLDVDGDPVSWIMLTGPENGTLSGTAPNLVYTPDSGFVGSDTFTFKVNDGTADSNVATVTINVSALYIYLPFISK